MIRLFTADLETRAAAGFAPCHGWIQWLFQQGHTIITAQQAHCHRAASHLQATGNSVHHFKTDQQRGEDEQDAAEFEAPAGGVRGAIQSFRVRAASFASSVSESGGLAAEALSSAIGAAMREASSPGALGGGGGKPRRSLKGGGGGAATSLPGAAPDSNRPSGTAPRHIEGGDVAYAPAPSQASSPRAHSPALGSGAAGAAVEDVRVSSTSPEHGAGVSVSDDGAACKKRTTVTFVDDAAAPPPPARAAPHKTKSRSRLQSATAPEPPAAPEERTSPGKSPRGKRVVANPLPQPEPLQLPAAKGGKAEPGLWVLRRTGCVRNKYLMADSLGRGQFGAVCVAMERSTGERWACKSVSKRRVQVWMTCTASCTRLRPLLLCRFNGMVGSVELHLHPDKHNMRSQGMHDFSMTDVLREVEVLYTVGGHPGVVGLREVSISTRSSVCLLLVVLQPMPQEALGYESLGAIMHQLHPQTLAAP